MNKRSFFIAGTDTGIGKSLVTGLLAKSFMELGSKVITQKWIQTGDEDISSDILTHLELMGISFEEVVGFKDMIMPYVFDFPASPHLASKKNDIIVEVAHIIETYTELKKHFDVVLVEGSGGVMVPVREDVLMIDICADLKIPVILVVGNKLGAINHSLLSIEVLRSKNIELKGLVFNDICKETPIEILDDNIRIIEKISGLKTIAKIKFNDDALPPGNIEFKI